ncbi:MAG: carboxylating nicotinate-nucleotide diphosphorylase [Dethiobacteria bacterium]|nr:carboxylating nicotinate-nucleotide diphosphorylase [Dethiobacteria bacterium]
MLTTNLINDLLKKVFREDIGSGDLTTIYCVPPDKVGSGRLIAKEEGVLAGIDIAVEAFSYLDRAVRCTKLFADGEKVSRSDLVMTVEGPLQQILSSERIALNLLQRLSGIATQTALWAEEIKEYPAKLTDTRKTTPGLRILEKYAVQMGGGQNHRLALDGGIMIKDNHIVAAGGIDKAVQAARKRAPFTLKIEVEVTNLEELQEAIAAGADIIMLDNMDPETMHRAVEITASRVLLEASGNVTFSRLREIAATGVDYISCGALTHSVKAFDFSFLLNQ